MIDKVYPCGTRVLAKRESTEAEKNGLFIPEQYRDKNQFAKVYAIGKDTKEVKKGDKILTKKHWGEGVPVGEDFFIIKEEEILAYIRED